MSTSDVDVTIVFKGHFASKQEEQEAQSLVANLPAQPQIDASIEEEAALLIQAAPDFKLAAQLLYGEEIRHRLSLISIDAWTRDRMHTSYWRLVKLFHRSSPILWPLDYPDPNDAFYGYVRRPIQLEDGDEIVSTRDLMRAVGWMATALIALRSGRYVTRKADTYVIYQQVIDDEWGAFVEEVYRCCKVEWQYHIPEDRAALRDLCRRTLGFENYFLAIYRGYLLQELNIEDEVILRHLLWLLEQIPWRDDEISRMAQVAQQKLASKGIFHANNE